MLLADSVDHLGQVEILTPGQIMIFGNLEYTVDSCGELNLSSWVSNQIEEQKDRPFSAPMSDRAWKKEKKPTLDPEMNSVLKNTRAPQALDLAPQTYLGSTSE